MDFHIEEFYRQSSDGGHFHKVISLNQHLDMPWETINKKASQLPKGWFELAHLSKRDRIDFTRDFWLSTLPYHPLLQEFIENFFGSLDDILLFLVQKTYDDSLEPELVYSLSNNAGFFRGCISATDDQITELEREFAQSIFPPDYLSFLRIHNGFCKATDSTGILQTQQVYHCYKNFQKMIENMGARVTTERGTAVNPKSLIPFYESFGMPFYQCFWGDWYPQNVTGMGNVYFSVTTKTISEPLNYEDSASLNMAYTTFTDWLMFYLERIE